MWREASGWRGPWTPLSRHGQAHHLPAGGLWKLPNALQDGGWIIINEHQ